MKPIYRKTAALLCVLGLAGAAPALAKKGDNVLPQKFSNAITADLLNRPQDITITKVAVPAEGAKGAPAGAPPAGMPGGPGGAPGGPVAFTQGTAANVIDSTSGSTVTGQVFGSSGDDENALRVIGTTVTLTDVDVDKEAGASSSQEAGDFFGMNAALLATDGAEVNISDSTISSSAKNGNGLFSYGGDTVVNAENVTITTTGNNSGGLQTTGGGTTIAKNVTVTTSGDSSAAIRSDRGGGVVQVDGGTYTTEGYGSPAIYSTADITVRNAALQANASEGAVIEGKNKIALVNCTLEGNMPAKRRMGQQVIDEENVHGVMVYQSMSGDADVGQAAFSMDGGILTSHRGDVIYVTNTEAALQLRDVKIVNLDENGALLRVAGNSGRRGWGEAGKNGGHVIFTTEDEKLTGNIVVDTVSHLTMTLGKDSGLKGIISIEPNSAGTTADHGIDLTIEKGATWELTGDSTVTTLTNRGMVKTNGHTLTVLKK